MRALTRPSLPKATVYFVLSSGVSVLSSPPWNFTNCQEVPSRPAAGSLCKVCVHALHESNRTVPAKVDTACKMFIVLSCFLSGFSRLGTSPRLVIVRDSLGRNREHRQPLLFAGVGQREQQHQQLEVALGGKIAVVD